MSEMTTPDADAYVSTACRVHDHETCRNGPIVRCACRCHGEPQARDGNVEGPGA